MTDSLKPKYRVPKWSEIVPPEIVRRVQTSKQSLVVGRGNLDFKGEYFYDPVTRRRISVERAIVEGLIRVPMKIRVEDTFFRKVESNEYGFLLAMMPILNRMNSHSSATLMFLRDQDRSVIDPFFGEMLDRISERLEDQRF
jgi:hypothetical protein